MLHPTYKIHIGDRTVDPSSNDLLSLTVDTHLDTPADGCRMLLRPTQWSAGLYRDNPVTVSLGYEDDLQQVFAGNLDSIDRGLSSVRIFAMGKCLKLLDLRVSENYKNQSAGEIVTDLVHKAWMDTGDIEPGLDLPSYYVDKSHNAYDHIRALAERCAFDVYVTPEGRLNFKEYKSAEALPLEYGKNIINIEASFQKPTYESVKAYGESPSSRKGDDTSDWLTKDEVSGEVGSGNQLEIMDPAIRDTDTAKKVAQARLKVLSPSKFVNLIVIGSPKIKLGDTVEVKKMPDDTLNGELKVTRVEHILSKSEGFTTHIECEGGQKQ